MERKIDFNLSKWRKGECNHTVTRDGRLVEILCYTRRDVEYTDGRPKKPIVGLVGAPECPQEVYVWTVDGKFRDDRAYCVSDLMLIENVKVTEAQAEYIRYMYQAEPNTLDTEDLTRYLEEYEIIKKIVRNDKEGDC